MMEARRRRRRALWSARSRRRPIPLRTCESAGASERGQTARRAGSSSSLCGASSSRMRTARRAPPGGAAGTHTREGNDAPEVDSIG